ncbi:MAG: autotransporter outer membrane beta-barrel domain-containing protein, partial [Methylophilus sp.]
MNRGSIWKGTINYQPGSSDLSIGLTTTWKMTGNSTLNVLKLGATGHINLESLGSELKAKTLSIDKLFGEGGLITLNQVLGDGSVPGDKIIIRDGGKVSGTTYLAIRNAGGLGGQTSGNGMLVVEAQANADTTAQSSKDGFKLKQPVYAGAYEYKLRAGDANGLGQNWYLSSQFDAQLNAQLNARHAYRPASAALPALMDLSGRMALHALLHGPQAVGTALDTSAETTARHPMWLFASQERLHAGGNGDINPAYSSWISGLHLGSDLWRNEESTTRLGAYGSVLYSQGDASGLLRSSTSSSDAGNLSQTTYLGGVYLHSQLPKGVYLKTALQVNHGKGSISSGDHATLKSNGVAASVQAGLPIPLNQSMTFEPQAQLIYQVQDYKDLHLSGETKARLDSDNSVLSRLGARLALEDKQASLPWVTEGLFNVWHRSEGEQRVRFSTPAAQSRVEA